MDTGKLMNNRVYLEGFEDEPEVILSIKEYPDYSIHLWEGYFEDIFGKPPLDGDGWKGFTRDNHQMEGAFSMDALPYDIDADEYLHDMMAYADCVFDYDETAEAFALVTDFLRFAIDNMYTVVVSFH